MSTLARIWRWRLWLVLGPIWLYQHTLRHVLPPACRYLPTCSEYMYEAVELYGIIRGVGLGLWRIMRCNPWGGSGWDPVPGSPLAPPDPEDENSPLTHNDHS